MKKIRRVVLFSVFATVLILGFILGASAKEYQGYSYEINGNGATITSYNDYTVGSENIVIPDTLDGFPVTTIADNAFRWNSSTYSIKIPDTVTSIGDSAFLDCDKLKEIEIPDSVYYIGEFAFSGCESLESINIPDSVKAIGDYTFDGCNNLKNINISDNIIEIGRYAFENTGYFLNEENWEEDVLYLGDYLIACKTNKEGVCQIKNGTKVIAAQAFYGCSKLNGVIIPDTVIGIGRDAFEYTSIYEDGSIWDNGVLYIGNHLIACKTDKTGVYNVRDNTKSIAEYAFSGCENLTQINIPDSVINIGKGAFSYCDNLISVKLPSEIMYINDCLFDDCWSLTEVIIPESVKEIGAESFAYCNSLNSITIPSNTHRICERAFSLSGLTEIEFSDGLIYIGKDAFSSTNLCNIKIPDTVIYICDAAFSGCSSLNSVDLGDNIKYIGYEAFGACFSLTSLYIPDSVEYIGFSEEYELMDSADNRGAFRYCSSLMEISVDANNKYYSNDSYGVLFNKDKSVLLQYPIGNNKTYYKVPESVIIIGSFAFYESDLINIDLPESLNLIGEGAFSSCRSLKSIKIPGSVNTISENAFSGCYRLENVLLENGIKEIDFYAFSGCAFEKIFIPESVEYIGRTGEYIHSGNAFEGCYFEVDKNNKEYTSDEFGALYDKAKTVLINYPSTNQNEVYKIPNSVTEINYEAFENNIYLKELYIPYSIIKIGPYLSRSGFIDGCINMTDIYYGDSEEKWNERFSWVTEEYDYLTIHFHKHDTVFMSGCPATCLNEGYEDYEICKLCDYSTYQVIPALGHNYIEKTVEADCTSNGYTYFECSNCNDRYDGYIISPNGHNDNNNDGYCDDCGEGSCNCKCHSNGFLKFIYKILNFFKKIFGNAPCCEC